MPYSIGALTPTTERISTRMRTKYVLVVFALLSVAFVYAFLAGGADYVRGLGSIMLIIGWGLFITIGAKPFSEWLVDYWESIWRRIR